jgi:hypothetical protein
MEDCIVSTQSRLCVGGLLTASIVCARHYNSHSLGDKGKAPKANPTPAINFHSTREPVRQTHPQITYSSQEISLICKRSPATKNQAAKFAQTAINRKKTHG